MKLKQYLPVVVFVSLLLLLPLILLITDSAFLYTQITMSLYYTLVVVGLCLLMGYAGQISLGHAGFVSIGGYMQAMLTTHDFTELINTPWQNIFGTIQTHFSMGTFFDNLPEKFGALVTIPIKWFVEMSNNIGVMVTRVTAYGEQVLVYSPWAAIVISLLAAVGIAYLIGLPVLRLKGHYLAMATLGFGIIVAALVIGLEVFGYSDGISGVPQFQIAGPVAVSGDMPVRIINYFIAGGILLIAVVVSMHIINSRVGRALRAIHGNEQAAGSLGINAMRYKLGAFVLSALFAAMAGAFLVHYNGSIGTSETSVTQSVRYVAIVAAGGMDSLWGVVVMSMGLNFISLRDYLGSFNEVFFAIILIITMLFLPRGLFRKEYVLVILKKMNRIKKRILLKQKLRKKGILLGTEKGKKDNE